LRATHAVTASAGGAISPLEDIGNAAQVHGVLNNGQLLDAADLRKW
jgi:hypothetical protein